MSALSDWIKERRKALGLSQTQVATKLGVNQGQVSHLENGKFAPDAEMMAKLDAILGKFTGSFTPQASSAMSERSMNGLKAYRESKDSGFCLKIDANIVITADRNQYILKQGANTSYFTQLASLAKYLVVSQARQSSVDSVLQVCNKLDEIYALIDKKFSGFDPANVEVVEFIPDDDEEDDEARD